MTAVVAMAVTLRPHHGRPYFATVVEPDRCVRYARLELDRWHNTEKRRGNDISGQFSRGTNTGIDTSSWSVGTKRVSTGTPTATASGSQSMTFVITRGPSTNST